MRTRSQAAKWREEFHRKQIANGNLPRDSYPTDSIAPEGRDLLLIAALVVVSRLLLILVGHLAANHAGNPSVELFCRFDCNWYLSIAEHGYSALQPENQPGATNYGFFPLYPILVRTAMPFFGGNAFYAALAVSNFALYAGLCYVYRYALLIGASRNEALLAVAMLCFFPQSFAFSVPYSESVFLLLFAASTYYLLRENFLVAGVTAALLSASRPTGVLFLVFILIHEIRSRGWRNVFTPWHEPERYIPLLFAPLGLFLYMGYCFLTVGDAFAHTSTEVHGWGYHFVAPWRGAWALLRLGRIAIAAVLFSFVVFAFSLFLLRRRRYEEFGLCLAFLLLFWSSPSVGSMFRYWLVQFPVWLELMRRVHHRPALVSLSFAVLAILNGIMMWAWTLQEMFAI